MYGAETVIRCYGLDGQEISNLSLLRDVLVFQSVQMGSRVHRAPFEWTPEALFPEVEEVVA
jgi:hypothetical protein